MIKYAVLCLLIILVCSGGSQNSPMSVPVFPGAVGFGTETPAGRGGKIHIVTNLNDNGPGSLRAALEAKEPRIIVFEVGGVIKGKVINIFVQTTA